MGALSPRRLSRAANARTNDFALAAFLWHPMPWVARAAAANSSTPAWARKIATKRKCLADVFLSRVDTPSDVIDRFARDAELPAELLVLIAENENTSPASLARVASHPNVTALVLYRAVRNPNTSHDTLDYIVTHSVTHTSPGSTETLHIFEAAAGRPDLPSNTLSWLARRCSDPAVLAAVASNPNTPPADAVFAALTHLTSK